MHIKSVQFRLRPRLLTLDEGSNQEQDNHGTDHDEPHVKLRGLT